MFPSAFFDKKDGQRVPDPRSMFRGQQPTAPLENQ